MDFHLRHVHLIRPFYEGFFFFNIIMIIVVVVASSHTPTSTFVEPIKKIRASFGEFHRLYDDDERNNILYLSRRAGPLPPWVTSGSYFANETTDNT